MSRHALLPLWSLGFLFLAGDLHGQITFRKIADSTSVLPNVVRSIKGLSVPSLRGNTVAFGAIENPGYYIPELLHLIVSQGGIFSEMAVDQHALPNGDVILISQNQPLLIRADGSVVFEDLVAKPFTNTPISRITGWKDGASHTLFDSTILPGLLGSGNLWFSAEPKLSEDGRVVRAASANDANGFNETVLIQEQGGQVSILSRSSTLPDYHPGIGLGPWSAFRDGLVFQKSSTSNLTYRQQGQETSVIGTSSNTFPGLDGIVWSVADIQASERFTVMSALRRPVGPDEVDGIYGWAGGSWFTIAEEGMPAPGGGIYEDIFQLLTNACLDDGSLVFEAVTTQGLQILLYHEGTVTPVLTQGQTLDGRTLYAPHISSHSLSGGKLAFLASFSTPGPQYAIYTADLSSLMTNSAKSTAVSTDLGPGRKVNLTVPAPETDHVYYLNRSTDLVNWTVVDQKTGSAGGTKFERDEESTGTPRAYFRVDERKR